MPAAFTLLSYGCDGIPGGIDFDLDKNINDHPWPPVSSSAYSATVPAPSFHRFLYELSGSKDIIRSCIFSGVLAFFLTLYAIRKSKRDKTSTPVAVNVFVIFIVTLMFAFFIMQPHIPPGH